MATPTAPSDPVIAERLDGLLRRAVDRTRHVRHGLLGVAALDSSRAWQGAHGDLDGQGTAATPGARYPVASVTKLLTAATVLHGVEQDRWRLEDRLVGLRRARDRRALRADGDVVVPLPRPRGRAGRHLRRRPRHRRSASCPGC